MKVSPLSPGASPVPVYRRSHRKALDFDNSRHEKPLQQRLFPSQCLLFHQVFHLGSDQILPLGAAQVNCGPTSFQPAKTHETCWACPARLGLYPAIHQFSGNLPSVPTHGTMAPKTQPSVTHASTNLWLHISSFGLEAWNHSVHEKAPLETINLFLSWDWRVWDLASLLQWIVGESHTSVFRSSLLFFSSISCLKQRSRHNGMHWPVFLMFRHIWFSLALLAFNLPHSNTCFEAFTNEHSGVVLL